MDSKRKEATANTFYFKDLPQYVLNKFKDHQDDPSFKVILLFIDGFGMNLLRNYGSSVMPLQNLLDHAKVYKNISLFPSSTPAHLSTIHGESAYQTGVTEWLYYNNSVDLTISPFMFSSLSW